MTDNYAILSAVGAEKSVLSLMLKDPSTYVGQGIETGMTEDWFYLSGHKDLYRLLAGNYEAGRPCDITSMTQTLTERGQLESLGGIAGLAELYSYDSLGAYFVHHVGLIKDKKLLRSVINICNTTISNAYDVTVQADQFIDQLEQSIFSVREAFAPNSGKSMPAIMSEAIANIERYITSRGAIQGLTTGYRDLDSLTNGLKGGDMFVIAARPSMGKTSFLLNILEDIALNQRKPVMMFSCEMPAVQLVERLLFARSGVARGKCAREGLNREDKMRFAQAVGDLKNTNLIIDDTASITINELRAKARRAKRDHNIAALGIDYLQLMRSYTNQAQNSREREIAEISAGLKALAKELNIPVIVLAQLNRGPENRNGSSLGVPRMSDLRESGAIEQDADMIGLLYRVAYYSENKENETPEERGAAFLDLAKNRNGATGKVTLNFIPELMRFAPVAKTAVQ